MTKVLLTIFLLTSVCMQSLLTQVKPMHWCEVNSASTPPLTNDIVLRDRTSITIPVVVHFLYRDENENHSFSRVQSQLDVLNEDFNAQSINSHITPENFKELEANMEITFCLAHTDPEGNYTSGITRTEINTNAMGIAKDGFGNYIIHYTDKGGIDAWDPERYLNIWVADMGGALGRSSFPWSTPKLEDGIVIDSRYFGRYESDGSPIPYSLGRTATHEVGHFLGLYHVHGQAAGFCDEDDEVVDTPPQLFPNFNCPKPGIESCGGQDMFMNFMDLTNDACMSLFTLGQKERVYDFLSLRASLIDSPVCAIGNNGPDFVQDETIYALYDQIEQSLNIRIFNSKSAYNDIRIIDLAGKVVAQQNEYSGSSFIFSAHDWPRGLYIILVSHGKKVKESIKLAVY